MDTIPPNHRDRATQSNRAEGEEGARVSNALESERCLSLCEMPACRCAWLTRLLAATADTHPPCVLGQAQTSRPGYVGRVARNRKEGVPAPSDERVACLFTPAPEVDLVRG